MGWTEPVTGPGGEDSPARPAAPDLSRLYRSHSGRVLGLCLRLLRSREEAEEAAAEAFLRAQRAAERYDGARPFASWVLTIAGRVCIDRLRRRRVERRIFSVVPAAEPAGPRPGPLAELLAAEERRRVRGALGELPAPYRSALVLRYYGELTYAEIGEALGVSRNQVATLIFRAKRRLRGALAAAADEEST